MWPEGTPVSTAALFCMSLSQWPGEPGAPQPSISVKGHHYCSNTQHLLLVEGLRGQGPASPVLGATCCLQSWLPWTPPPTQAQVCGDHTAHCELRWLRPVCTQTRLATWPGRCSPWHPLMTEASLCHTAVFPSVVSSTCPVLAVSRDCSGQRADRHSQLLVSSCPTRSGFLSPCYTDGRDGWPGVWVKGRSRAGMFVTVQTWPPSLPAMGMRAGLRGALHWDARLACCPG